MSTGRLPSEADIEKVMNETGMERMQAYRHLVQRYELTDSAARGARRHAAITQDEEA